MSEQRTHKFAWGQKVFAGINLFNDGTHPERSVDVLLVERGTRGEVVQVGLHEDSNTPIYLVEFDGSCVVGCLEEEIALEFNP